MVTCIFRPLHLVNLIYAVYGPNTSTKMTARLRSCHVHVWHCMAASVGPDWRNIHGTEDVNVYGWYVRL